MDLNQKCVPVSYFRLLTGLFQQWGITPETLLEGTGVKPGDLENPTSYITYNQEIAIYERAERLSPVPEWALRLGQNTHVSAAGVTGYAMLTCVDIAQCLQLAVRYIKLTGSAAGTELRELANGDYEVCALDAAYAIDSPRYVMEEFFTAMLTALKDVSQGAIGPKMLNLVYPRPDYAAVYREVFNCPVNFNAERSGLIVDKQDLTFRVPTWDPVTQEACRRQCEQVLEQLTEAEGFVDTVRKILLVQPCDQRTAGHVAEKLHISTRNLRRKLEQEKTSFQQVLDDVRCELAKNYLSKTRLRLEDIAPLLGFSETSNLRRAFKKWTNQTPSQYRDTLLSESG